MKIHSRIVLSITDRETNAEIKKTGVGLLELRADLFKKLDPDYCLGQIRQRKLLKIPLLLTLRNDKKEGAARAFSDELKWQVLTEALPLVEMVDIELSSPLLKQTMVLARKLGKKTIVSSHYLQRMPRDLGGVFRNSLRAKGDIVKIAAKAGSFGDVMALLEFTWAHRKERLITMCLGPVGTMSRLVFPAAGSLYTYAFLNEPTAPGQLDIATLKSHLKVYYP